MKSYMCTAVVWQSVINTRRGKTLVLFACLWCAPVRTAFSKRVSE